MKTTSLVIRLDNKKTAKTVKGKKCSVGSNRTSTFGVNIIGDTDAFSAKYVRKAMHKGILRIMHQPKDAPKFAKGISAGEKVYVTATFGDMTPVQMSPIYFGGGKGAPSLKHQLSLFVTDLKDLIEDEDAK